MEYKLTQKDLIRAQIEYGLGTNSHRIFIAVSVIFAYCAKYFIASPIADTAHICAIYFTIGYLFIIFILTPYLSYTSYKSYKLLQLPVSLTANETGLKFTRESGEFFLSWENIYQWRSLSDSIMVMVSKRVFYIIPKSQIGKESSEAIIKLLKEHVGNAT
jgi:hypothetical protein